MAKKPLREDAINKIVKNWREGMQASQRGDAKGYKRAEAAAEAAARNATKDEIAAARKRAWSSLRG